MAFGDVHGANASAPVESEHSNAIPAPWGPNSKLGDAFVVGPEGALVMSTAGPTVSMRIVSGSDGELSPPPLGFWVYVTV